MLPAVAWIGLLGLLPWWVGAMVLCVLVAGAVYFDRRYADRAEWCRRGLRWGLPGVLFALQRALGGDVLAWGAALLGALVGFSLVALLESLLDRRVRRATAGVATAEWRELAMARVGPPACIIELLPVDWCEVTGPFVDPHGEPARFEPASEGRGRYVFGEGRVIDQASPRCCFGPGGRWFVASLPEGRGDILWDRRGDHLHRLVGWELYGWEGEQPWLSQGVDGVPAPIHEVLGSGR
ncbi:DUF3488 domain-containing protein [Dyella sp. ASV21]|uniref:DUF3488 domain-containing protein n=1 Tax=Dyella sp. ASV21 TaxID=2795114 RepID=UPI0018EE4151|nr:DUF3488 domain-containing protein [Dyella sp. ASV21]